MLLKKQDPLKMEVALFFSPKYNKYELSVKTFKKKKLDATHLVKVILLLS